MLFYNDYSIASSTGWSSSKSDAVYELVKNMIETGVPIDGVGLQVGGRAPTYARVHETTQTRLHTRSSRPLPRSQMHVDVDYDLVDGVAANIQRWGCVWLYCVLWRGFRCGCGCGCGCVGVGVATLFCPQTNFCACARTRTHVNAIMRMCAPPH